MCSVSFELFSTFFNLSRFSVERENVRRSKPLSQAFLPMAFSYVSMSLQSSGKSVDCGGDEEEYAQYLGSDRRAVKFLMQFVKCAFNLAQGTRETATRGALPPWWSEFP